MLPVSRSSPSQSTFTVLGLPRSRSVHVLPRWTGDSNFMTTVGGVRVLSESLDESYSRLLPFFGGGE